MAKKNVLYPGNFDPVTVGHLDLVRRSLALFDEVTVAVAKGTGGEMFTLQERVDMFAAALQGLSRCRVVSFAGLLVDELQRQGAVAAVRGIRSGADYQQEWSLAGMNGRLWPEGEYVYLLARPELAFISSSLVRDVARHGGDVSAFVVPVVAEAMRQRCQDGSS